MSVIVFEDGVGSTIQNYKKKFDARQKTYPRIYSVTYIYYIILYNLD